MMQLFFSYTLYSYDYRLHLPTLILWVFIYLPKKMQNEVDFCFYCQAQQETLALLFSPRGVIRFQTLEGSKVL